MKRGGWPFSSKQKVDNTTVENTTEYNEFTRILRGLSQDPENGKTSAESTIARWLPEKQDRFNQWREKMQNYQE